MICKIDVGYTSKHQGSYLPPLRTISASAVTLLISNVPSRADGVNVSEVEVKAVNTKGEVCAIIAGKVGGSYVATLPAAFFAEAGIITSGLVIIARGKDVLGAVAQWILGVGDIDIVALNTGAVPLPEEININDFSKKGADVYVKSRIVAGVQHYCLQTIKYDEEMRAWGAVWSGDYILNDQGQFEEVLNG
jgi:hypothetical protein